MSQKSKEGGPGGVVETLAEAAIKAGKAAEAATKTQKAEPVTKAKTEARKYASGLVSDPTAAEVHIQKLVQGRVEPTFEQAKTKLEKALAKHTGGHVAWLSQAAESIKSDAGAADFAANLLSTDAQLQNDPFVLLHEGSKLFWSTRWAELPAEAHAERRAVLKAVYERINELARVTPEFQLKDMYVQQALLPEARMGMMQVPDRPVKVYDETEDANTFTDDRLKAELNRIQHRIAFDRTYTSDSGELIRDKRAVIDLMSQGVPETEVREAIRRIDELLNFAARREQDRFEKQGRLVVWKDEWTERFRNVSHSESLQVGHLTKDDVDMITSGEEGQFRWLSEFRQSIYEMGKGDAGPSFTDQMRWDDFERLVDYLWGEEYKYIPKRLKQRWESYGRLDGIVKGLTYRPGPLEQKAKAFAFLTPHDIDDLLDYDLVELARPLYSDAVRHVMENQSVTYFDALEYLTTKVENPFEPGKMLTREELLDVLAARAAAPGHEPGSMGGLTPEQDLLMREIRINKDVVGNGVILRDIHMLSNQRQFEDLSRLYTEYNGLKWKQDHADAGRPFTPEDQQRMDDLKGRIGKMWKEYSLNPHYDKPPEDLAELNAVRGLSPVEIEVRERLVDFLRSEGMSNADIVANEWKIRDAIWASRNMIIGMGEAMEVGAHMGIAPRTGDQKGAMVKYFMNGPFAEPVQRVLNESLFRDRFNMGGKVGEVSADLLYSKALERAKYDIMKDAPEEWKKRLREAERAGKPTWRIVMQYAQDELGLSFTEAVRPEVLATGLQNVSTNWRNETAVLDPIQEYLYNQKKAAHLSEDAILDNEGLAIQYYLGKPNERTKILERMMQRKPSAFFEMLGHDFHEKLEQRTGINLRSKEWRQFQRALSMAEITTWRDQARRTGIFDFANRANFNEVMPHMMEAAGIDIQAHPEILDRYHDAITFMKEYMHEAGPSGTTRIDRWRDHGFKKMFQLVSSDFNWKESRITRLGAYTLERRINDFMGMAKARDILFDFLYNKDELLSPLPGKETDSIMKIDELRDTIIGYAGVDDAEEAAALLAEVWLDFNWNRASRTIAGWLPGAVSLMKRAGYVHLDDIGILKAFPGAQKFIAEAKIGGIEFEKLPKSVAQMVSYSVGLGGHEGNAWDEFKIAGLLAGMENRFIFADRPELLHALEKRYHTGMPDRIVGTMRKYWFIVFLGTMALAASQATEEEKKKG